MLKLIQTWLQHKINSRFFADVLDSKTGQEELLGMAQLNLPNAGQVLNDVHSVINYTHSSEYKVWAKEAWSKIITDLDKLLNPTATQEQINFYRGSISSTLALLRISYMAKFKEPAIKKQVELSRK